MLSVWSAILSLKGKQKDRQIDPKQFLVKLGQCCKFCEKKVIYSNSASICHCKEYGHLQCTKKHLNTFKLIQTDQVTCQTCNQSIQLTYEKQIKIGLNIKLQNSVLIVFLCISIAFLFLSIKEQYKLRSSQRDLLMVSFQMFLIMILIIALLVMIFMSVVYSEFKVKDIKKTKNQMIASAFEGVLTHRNDDSSSNVIFT